MKPARLLAGLLPALVALGLFLPVLEGGFVYDDEPLIRDHAFLHRIEAVWEGFAHPFWETVGELRTEKGYYRPLATAVFALLWQAGGGGPWVFHLASLLLYALIAALVARTALCLGWSPWAAAAAGLAFAVHGAHVEPVAWISALPYLLAALFSLQALTAAWEGRGRAAAAWLLPALLSHEASFGPALLAAALLVRGPARASGWRERSHGPGARLLPLAAVLGVVWAARALVFGSPAAGFGLANDMYAHLEARFAFGALDRAALSLALVTRYLAFLLWPAPHAHFRPLRVDQGFAELLPEAAAGAVFLGGGALLWWRVRRPEGLVRLPLGLLLAGLLPVLNLRGIGLFPFEERFTLLPSLGFALLAGGLLFGTSPEPSPRRRLAGGLAAVLAAVPHALNVRRTIPVWRDNPTFYAWAVEQSPESVSAWIYLANEKVREAQELPPGDPERARLVQEILAAFERTLQIDRHRWYISGLENERRHALQGNALLLDQDLSTAELYWDRVLRESPGEPHALAGKAQALAQRADRAREQGEHERARELYEQAIRLYRAAWQADGELSAALHGHALCLLRLARPAEAAPLLQRAAALRPRDFEIQSTLARALSELGRHEEALRTCARLLEGNPLDPRGWVLQGELLNRQAEERAARGEAPEDLRPLLEAARDAFRNALELGSRDPAAHFGLGYCYDFLGRKEDAEREFRRAIAADPARLDFARALALFLAQAGRITESREVLEDWLRVAPAADPRRASVEELASGLRRIEEEARRDREEGSPAEGGPGD